MNVVLLKSRTLVIRELQKALDRRNDIRLINIEVPVNPSKEIIQQLIEKLTPYLPALFFSINNAGLDINGNFQKNIEKSGSILINWYHDYPFFEDEFLDRVTTPSPNRIDFISEESYIPLLKERGFNPFFMPLAVDLDFFNTNAKINYKQDISFVGNSTLELMDMIIDDNISNDIEKNGEIFKKLKQSYKDDFTFDVRAALIKNKKRWINNISTIPERFIFVMEWMVGYQYRRDAVVNISKVFKDQLTIFGDPYWKNFINDSKISSDACYYDNLCSYYRNSKINLNINRIQISSSFTQRHFDTKASGAFLLTEKRALNSRFFITEGSNQEIAEFTSTDECIDKIEYYLSHEAEREEIALNGIERIKKNHTYDNRLEEMLQIIKKVYAL